MNALGDWLEAIVVGVIALVVGMILLGRMDTSAPSAPITTPSSPIVARGHVPTATPSGSSGAVRTPGR